MLIGLFSVGCGKQTNVRWLFPYIANNINRSTPRYGNNKVLIEISNIYDGSQGGTIKRKPRYWRRRRGKTESRFHLFVLAKRVSRTCICMSKTSSNHVSLWNQSSEVLRECHIACTNVVMGPEMWDNNQQFLEYMYIEESYRNVLICEKINAMMLTQNQ